MTRERLIVLAALAASLFLFAAVPLLTLGVLLADWNTRGLVAVDFRQFYWAAEAILQGASPYPSPGDLLGASAHRYPYPYPPLPALAAVPFTALPLEAAGMLVTAAIILVALAIPFVLGVRDWRCYGLVLVWPPMLSAIQTSNPTLLLALAAALAWRFRGSLQRVGPIVGVTLAVKFFLWPLVVWLAATRRFASAVVAGVVGSALFLVSWSVIGLPGLVNYPALLRQAEKRWGADSYTTLNVALELGASPGVARALWLTIGLALLVAVVVMGRKGDDRTTFILAMAAAFALSPLVWLGYFAFFVVVIAIAQPRLGFLWFIPFAMFVSTGNDHPAPWVVSWTLAVAAMTFALALLAVRSPVHQWVFVRRGPALEARL